jgi:hypothetical protein
MTTRGIKIRTWIDENEPTLYWEDDWWDEYGEQVLDIVQEACSDPVLADITVMITATTLEEINVMRMTVQADTPRRAVMFLSWVSDVAGLVGRGKVKT